jgi:gag-polyprotein putative aspartyl protease
MSASVNSQRGELGLARKYLPVLIGIVVAVLLSGAQLVAQQEAVVSDTPKPVAKIAITLFHNRVYLPVKLNDHGPFEMVLDTGAAVSGLSEVTAQSVGLHNNGGAQLTGNGESRLKVAIAKNVTFRVGAAQGFRETGRHCSVPTIGVT